MKLAVYCISFFSFFLQLYAQQIEFKLNGRNNYGYSQKFNSRYIGPLYEDYNLENTGFYLTHKVKSMSVYRADNKLYRYWEFDTAGIIIKTGAQNYYYTEHAFKQTGPSKTLHITSYYLSPGGRMVRCDSVYRYYTRYTITDTVIGWSRYTIIVHKTGDLINEQNNYYNTHFYNKKVVVHDMGLGSGVAEDENGKFVNVNAKGHVFIQKKLKTNYKSDSVYRCSLVSSDEGFYASCNNGHKDLTRMQLIHHPAANKFNQNSQRIYFTDGEWFDEPAVDYNEPMECGYNRERHNEPWVHCSANSKGLYDTCYTMQLVLDTSRVARIKYEKQKREAIKMGAIIDGEDNGPYQEKPSGQMLYYFRYRYF